MSLIFRILVSVVIVFTAAILFLFLFKNVEYEKLDMIAYLNNLKGSFCVVKPLIHVHDFFTYWEKPMAKCDKLVEVGGRNFSKGFDGSKFVCFDKKYNIPSSNCIVLSFGINNEWSFDDAMDAYGCQVYAFDPSMDRENFDRTPRIHFYNIGLSDGSGKKTIRGKPRPVERYETLLAMTGLTNSKIDYLKMDIEGSEIEFFKDIFDTSPHLLKNINQISMEIHPGKSPEGGTKIKTSCNRFREIWKGMHRLECAGFQLAHFEMNRVKSNHYRYRNRTQSGCYELVWIKEKPI